MRLHFFVPKKVHFKNNPWPVKLEEVDVNLCSGRQPRNMIFAPRLLIIGGIWKRTNTLNDWGLPSELDKLKRADKIPWLSSNFSPLACQTGLVSPSYPNGSHSHNTKSANWCKLLHRFCGYRLNSFVTFYE